MSWKTSSQGTTGQAKLQRLSHSWGSSRLDPKYYTFSLNRVIFWGSKRGIHQGTQGGVEGVSQARGPGEASWAQGLWPRSVLGASVPLEVGDGAEGTTWD